MKMTNKQKRFCDEYLIDMNATQSAIRAGYSPKTAKVIGNENLSKPYLKAYIEKRLKEKEDNLIATQDEVLRYLTSVMRGESESEIVVVEGCGDGVSEAKRMLKAPDERERLKASELLAKRYGILSDKVKLDGVVPVVIGGSDDLED
jgi:phage terminase small subunit